jgi:dTDP-4-amino-4,6-dideoxygalactose transaminase
VGAFPNAEQVAGEILSLPIYPGITRSQQERVAEVLVSALG